MCLNVFLLLRMKDEHAQLVCGQSLGELEVVDSDSREPFALPVVPLAFIFSCTTSSGYGN